MRFRELPIPGAWVIDIEPQEDERGFFARAWSRSELEARGLRSTFDHAAMSRNTQRGTVRGLHFQADPFAEAKIVRCMRGAAFDVLVDARPRSKARGEWCSIELSAANARQVYVPEGVAHGFQTLADDTDLFYHITAPWSPEHQRGFRHDDPTIGIRWPLSVTRISERDSRLPPFR